MFQQSGEFAIRWQQNSSKLTSRGFKALSLILDLSLAVSGALLFLFSSARIKFFKFASFGIFSVFANVCVRMMYAKPRPFMVFDQLQIYECVNDFGSPSGHMFTESTLFYCLFHMYLIPWTQHRNTQKTAVAQGQPLYNDDIKSGGNYKFGLLPALLWILCFCIIGAIGISRIFLGDHSYNQIVLGIVYASAFTVYLFLLVDIPYGKFLQRIVDRSWKQSKKALAGITTAFIICLVVPIIIYEAQKAVLTYDPNWIRNIAVKCGETNPNNMLLPFDFANSGIIMLLFGGLYALLFTNGFYVRQYKSEKVSFGKEIARILLLILVAAPELLILQLVPWNQPYLSYIVGHCLLYFITFYAIYGIWPSLLHRCNLERSGDLLRKTVPSLAPAGRAVPQAGDAVAINIGNGQALAPIVVGPRVEAEKESSPEPRSAAAPQAAGIVPLSAEPQVAAERHLVAEPRVIAIREAAARMQPAVEPQVVTVTA